jgi:acyl carrier protein
VERDAGVAIIRELVADRLDVAVDEVRAGSRLVPELGADSLDFLDLVFSLEDRFKVKLRGSELSFLTRLGANDPEVIADGMLTEQALARLAPLIPEILALTRPTRITPRQLFDLVTVDTLWRAVAAELARQGGGGA